MAKATKAAEPVMLPLRPLQILLLISPFLAGLFFEYLACAVTLFLLVYILFAWKKKRLFVVPKSLTLLSVTVIVLFLGITALWAVDHGMALLGFAKFLVLPLFALTATQLSPSQRQALLQTVPLSGIAMTVLSYGLSFVPALRGFFLVNDRLAGFFQYPNVFALFLLVGIVLLVSQQQWKLLRIVGLLVLLFGLFQTGSRTTFILLVAAVIALTVFLKDKTTRIVLLSTVGLLLIATVIYVICTGNMSSIGRYLTTSLSESTFLGRLLYDKDALPVIASHPFGLGYLGYSFLQGSFQTGVYSVTHIHNELLQILLDVGWLPTVLAVFAFARSFLRSTPTFRILLALIAAHCLLDFDLQFPAIGFILILIMLQGETYTPWKSLRSATPVLSTVLALISLYFGIVSGLYYADRPQTAVKLYPAYTACWQQYLVQTDNIEQADYAANQILRYNQSVSLAYSAKARTAYSQGDFGSMILYKEKAIALSRYSLIEYLDYASMLHTGYQLYMQNYDTASAEICRTHLLKIPQMLADVEKKTSTIAWKLDDKPELTLPPAYQQAIQQLQ